MDDLDKAQQRESLGWDHEAATSSVERALRVINMATSAVERHYSEWLSERDDGYEATHKMLNKCAKSWAVHLRSMAKTEGFDKAKPYFNQLRSLQSHLEKLNDTMTLSPATIVKMSKDLSSIVKDLVNLLEKVDKLAKPVEANDLQKSLHELLSPEQQVQVYQWLRESEEG